MSTVEYGLKVDVDAGKRLPAEGIIDYRSKLALS